MGIYAMEDERQHMNMAKKALFFFLSEVGYKFEVSSAGTNSRL